MLGAPAMLGGALGYIGATLVPAAWHHAARWTLMSETMKSHAVGPRVLRLPAQVTAVTGQAVVGAGALYLALAGTAGTRSLTVWVLTASLALSAAFLGYVRALRRSGRRVPCGCYSLRAAEHAASASYTPSLALGVAAAIGLAAISVAPHAGVDATPTFAGRLMLVALGVALSVLVQCLALSRGSEPDQPSSGSAALPVGVRP